MTRPAGPGRIGAVAAAALMMAGQVALLGAPGAAARETADGQDSAADYQPCEPNTKRVKLVLAMDRSGSLTYEDPGGAERREALKVVRRELAQIIKGLPAGSGSIVDLALLSFDTEATVHAGFRTVSDLHPSDTAIEDVIAPGGNTDYRPAIDSALDLFDTSENSDDSSTTCRILVFFTDGILDPFNTVHLPWDHPTVDEAEQYAQQLIRDACSGPASYRHRFRELGVDMYAMLLGSAFSRRDNTHFSSMAIKSLQVILALTGDTKSPLLDGVELPPDCDDKTDTDGLIIALKNIGELVEDLVKVVEEISFAIRQPKLECGIDRVSAKIGGEWPGFGVVRMPEATEGDAVPGVCTIEAPADGTATITISVPSDARDVSWGPRLRFADDPIDDSAFGPFDPGMPAPQIRADDGIREIDLVSTLFPDDRLSPASSADLTLVVEWYPDATSGGDPSPARFLEQPVRIEFDRDAHFAPVLSCFDRVEANVTSALEDRVVTEDLCGISPPRSGTIKLRFVDNQANRLDWELLGDGQGDGRITASAPVDSSTANEVGSDPFKDRVSVQLYWRAPGGALLTPRPEDSRPEQGEYCEQDEYCHEIVIKIKIPPPPPPPPWLALLIALAAFLAAAVAAALAGCRLLTRTNRFGKTTTLFGWKQEITTIKAARTGALESPELRDWKRWRPEPVMKVKGRSDGRSLRIADLELRVDRTSCLDMARNPSGRSASPSRGGWEFETWPRGPRRGSLPLSFTQGAVVMGLDTGAGSSTPSGAVWVIYNSRPTRRNTGRTVGPGRDGRGAGAGYGGQRVGGGRGGPMAPALNADLLRMFRELTNRITNTGSLDPDPPTSDPFSGGRRPPRPPGGDSGTDEGPTRPPERDFGPPPPPPKNNPRGRTPSN